jgi:hypothetical protein
MARVFEKPRYINQARNRMLSLACATHNPAVSIQVARALECNVREIYATAQDYEDLADLAFADQLSDDDMPGVSLQLESYLLDAEIGRASASARLSDPDAAMRIVQDFLAVWKSKKPKEVMSDERAMFFLINRAMTDTRYVLESDESRYARVASHDLIFHQLISQKVAPGAFKKVFQSTGMRSSPPARMACYDQWVEAANSLQFRSQPMWVKYCRLWANPPRRPREHLRRMIDKVEAAGAKERFMFDALGSVARGSVSYNYAGILVLYIDDKMLILDNSSADYLRTCMTSLRNATWAFSMMRVSGDTGKHNLSTLFDKCVRWIAAALSDTSRARYVARHMHLAYVRWQNSVCEEDSPIDCGWRLRDRSLQADMNMVYPHTNTWYDMVVSLQVPERVKAEFFKLYHLLPPPDIDPLLLHNTLVERTSEENKCDHVAVANFIKFCKSYDLARYLAKRRRTPKMRCDPGYVPDDEPWFKKSKSGRLTMPPRRDWGKAQLHQEFPYDPTGDFHIFDAKDCTRVVADLDAYMNRSRSRDLSRVDQNELLSAIFHGPVLSNGETMQSWRDRVMQGRLNQSDHCLAAEAGKAENTKPHRKVRETLSGSDNVREFLTEVDHALRPLASLTPGVSIRVDLVKHKKKFQTMARSTSAVSTVNAFATSTDISGWSPRMPRHMFHAWQTYALSTTECPNPEAPIAIWDRLMLFVDRRGVKASSPCHSGNIQGWPATSDTVMHSHILIRWVYMLKEEKILSKNEAAYTLCLIDDAATVVALDGTMEECAAKASRARAMLSNLYTDLGFEMDDVKSFFSAIKFVYLNELYVDGTQVPHATKTMMRIDKDYTRRFSSLTDNINTAFGTAASASAQGGDPFVTYFLAAWVSYRWIFRLEPRFIQVPTHLLTMIALAPATLNGFGMKAITSTMATGEIDHLTWYIEVAGHLCGTVNNKLCDRVFSSILLQRPADRDAVSVFKAPFAYVADSHFSATGLIMDVFRHAARDHGLAEPFASMDKVETSDQYRETIESILQAGTHEAALLEEISGSMPEAFIDEVMARVERTELVSYLLGGKVIGDLRRRVLVCDQMNIGQALDLVSSAYQSNGSRNMVEEMAERGSFRVASDLRNAAFAMSGYTILNHTYPCPFSLWAYSGPVSPAEEKASLYTTVTFNINQLRKTAGSQTVNMYDSAPPVIGYKGYKTAKSNMANEARVLLYNPVRKKIAQGLAAFRWADATGAHHSMLYALFCQAWSGSIDPRLLQLPGRLFEGSAKRLSLRHSKMNHLISMFSNVQSAVRVNAQPITIKHAQQSTMYDMMAAVTMMRAAGLLEAALQVRLGTGAVAYMFAYKPASAAATVVPATLEPPTELPQLHLIQPFAKISSPLQSAAAVCCTFEAMAQVMQEYEASGARAAELVFEAIAEDGDIAMSALEAEATTTTQSLNVQSAIRYSELIPGWSAIINRRIGSTSGAVKAEPDRPVAVSSVQTIHPSLPPERMIQSLADSWVDTIALDLVHTDPAFAADIYEKNVKKQVDSIVLGEAWIAKRYMLRPKGVEIPRILRELDSIRSNIPMPQATAMLCRTLGATGLRISEDADMPSIVHSVDTYLSKTSSLLGLTRMIASSISRLKRKTRDEYSEVHVSTESSAVRNVSRILSAQWLLGAARRQKRSDEKMKSGQGGPNVTRDNYEGVFLRASAKALGATGKLTNRRLYDCMVDQVIKSLSRKIESKEKADQFIDDIMAAELDVADDLKSDEELIQHINAVSLIAHEHDSNTDTVSILEALDEVLGWVRTDMAGKHVVTGPRRKQVKPTLSLSNQHVQKPSQASESAGELVTAHPDVDFVFPEAIIGDADVEGYDIDQAPASDVAQWVIDDIDRRHVIGIPGVDLHSWYSEITASREAYAKFVSKLKATCDTTKYDPPEWSIFPFVDFDEEVDTNIVD